MTLNMIPYSLAKRGKACFAMPDNGLVGLARAWARSTHYTNLLRDCTYAWLVCEPAFCFPPLSVRSHRACKVRSWTLGCGTVDGISFAVGCRDLCETTVVRSLIYLCFPVCSQLQGYGCTASPFQPRGFQSKRPPKQQAVLPFTHYCIHRRERHIACADAALHTA